MKIKFSPTILLTTLLTLSGCSLSSAPSPEMEKITNQQTEIETLQAEQAKLKEQLALWQEMQPGVTRLIEVEDELNTLIKQLRDLTEANAMKAQDEQNKRLPARPFFMLQLGSFSNQGRLNNAWSSLQALHPVLYDLPVRYQAVELSGKQYFRLKVGEFNQKADALETCQALIDQETDCIIVNNMGKKL